MQFTHLTQEEKDKKRAESLKDFKEALRKLTAYEKIEMMEFSKTRNKTAGARNCYFVDMVCVKFGIDPGFIKVWDLLGDPIFQNPPKEDDEPKMVIDLRGMTRQQKIDYHKHRLQSIGSIKVEYIEDETTV